MTDVTRNIDPQILLNNLPGMVYQCKNDADWTMLFISSGCEELTGYTSDELQNNHHISFGNIIHEEDQDFVAFEVGKAVTLNIPWTIQYRIITKENQIKWVWEQGVRIFDNDNHPTHLEGFITDITEGKRLEDELKHSLKQKQSQVSHDHLASQYQTAIDDYCLVLKTDEEGHIRYVNPLFLETFGYQENDILNQSIADSPFMKQPEDQNSIWEIIQNQSKWKGELINHCKSGNQLNLKTRISAVRNFRGQIEAYLFIQQQIKH